jgi:hypothetical protein
LTGSAWLEVVVNGKKKQAAASAAARFLYMVFLYMAPVIEQNKTRRGAGFA